MKNEVARPKVILDGTQAEQELDKLTAKAKKYRDAMMEAAAAGDSQAEKRMQQQLKATNTEIRNLKKEAFDVDRVLKNINGASFNELSQAVRKATNDLKKMQQTDPGYTNQEQKVVALKTKLAELNATNSANVPLWSKLANGANKYFNMITLGIASITGILFSFAQFVKGMVGLDDALADVMKTTGLTRKEVRGMYQDFKLLNTRTPRAELLLLAEEAGRLGKVGKKDIMDFVTVANKIKISLGDDLGGNTELAIREVGKLTEIFRVGVQYNTDFKTSMEKVGSGLNQVANNSNASAEYLIEYMKRLGGIATQAKITAADIMGYASTFDQLGQNVEMAATAQSKVVVDMFTDPGKYAKIAKMEVGSFSQLLKTDANEAFIKFLDGLNGNNEGLSEMATKLDGLGIDGARATQALASLSSNTKMLREQQDLANDAMEKGTSLQNEYAIKNNNLAGSWAKLTAFINAQFINSNFIGFLENVIGKLAKMVEVTHPLTRAMKEEIKNVNLLTIELTNTNTPAERRNEIYAELKRIAPDVVANIDAENISISTLKGNLEQYNQEMIKKLALQDNEETLADKREAAGKATNKRVESEIKLREELYGIMEQSKYWNKNLTKDIENILLAPDDIITKYDKINTLLGTSRGNYITSGKRYTKAVVATREDEKKATDDVTKSLEDYMQRYEMVFGNKKVVPIPSPPDGDTPPPGGKKLTEKEIEAAAKAQKKASDKAIEQLEQDKNKEMAILADKYTTEGMTDAVFKAEQENLDVKYLLKKQTALLKHGQSTVDVDKQINDKRIQTQKEFNDLMSKAQADYMKNSEEQLLTKQEAGIDPATMVTPEDLAFAAQKHSLADWVDYLTQKTKEQIAIKTKALDDDKEMQKVREQIQDAQIGGIEQIAGALAGMFEQGSAAQIAFFALEKAMAIAQVWVNYARESSSIHMIAATMGPLGIAWEATMQPKALMNAGINTAIIAAQAVAQIASSKKSNNTSNSKQSGGFSNTDGPDYQPDGIYHKNEFIGSGPSVRNPTIKPIYDIINLAQQNGTIATLNLPAVLAATGMLPTGRQSGGYSSGSTSASSSYPQFVSESDTEMKQILSENLRAIRDLMKWKPKVTTELIKKDLKTLDDIESNRGL